MSTQGNPTEEVELAERLVKIESSIERVGSRIDSAVVALRADITHYFATLQDHETRVRSLEQEQTRHCGHIKAHAEKLSSLSARVNAWGSTNTIGAIVAGAIAWFK